MTYCTTPVTSVELAGGWTLCTFTGIQPELRRRFVIAGDVSICVTDEGYLDFDFDADARGIRVPMTTVLDLFAAHAQWKETQL